MGKPFSKLNRRISEKIFKPVFWYSWKKSTLAFLNLLIYWFWWYLLCPKLLLVIASLLFKLTVSYFYFFIGRDKNVEKITKKLMLFEECCLNSILQQSCTRLHGTQQEELAAISDRLVQLQSFEGHVEVAFRRCSRKNLLRNFAVFIGKHLQWSLFFKLQSSLYNYSPAWLYTNYSPALKTNSVSACWWFQIKVVLFISHVGLNKSYDIWIFFGFLQLLFCKPSSNGFQEHQFSWKDYMTLPSITLL